MRTSRAQAGAGVAFDDVSTGDLGFLLGAALSAPGAAAGAGPVVGAILAALVHRRADDIVERHLGAAGRGIRFGLRTYRVDGSHPVSREEGLNAPEALRLMLGRDEPGGGQELIIRRGDGTEASVAVRLGDGPLVYRFTESGDAGPAAGPVAPDRSPPVDLSERIREALVGTTIEVDLGGIEEVVARAVAGALPGPMAPEALAAAAPAPATSTSEEIATAVERRLRAVVEERLEALVHRGQEREVGRSEALLERLWLKMRAVAYQLRATGDALARVEAAVERVEQPGSPRSGLFDLVRGEIEVLRAEVARLAAAVSRIDGGEGLLLPFAEPGAGGDRTRPGRRASPVGSGLGDARTRPVPLAVVPRHIMRR